MIPDAIEVRLKPKERAELEARLRAATTEQRQLLRIRIVLEAAEVSFASSTSPGPMMSM